MRFPFFPYEWSVLTEAASPLWPPTNPVSQCLLAFLVLYAWLAVVLIRDRLGKSWEWQVPVKLNHLLPIVFQTVILSYWMLYVDEVRMMVPGIGVLLLFGVCFEVLLTATLYRKPTLSLGVAPIVLSTMLFVWFHGDNFYLFFVVITVGIASKYLVTWRSNGRHIFNPSALGTTVAGLLCCALPQIFGYWDIASMFHVPPNMSEVIFLVALVPQMRFGIATVTLGGYFSMNLINGFGEVSAMGITSYFPSPLWAPWLLTISLFSTDPLTIPKSATGRLLYGIGLGIGVQALAMGMTILPYIRTDFWAKVMAIPAMNLLVPVCERYGRQLVEWLQTTPRLEPLRSREWLRRADWPRVAVAVWGVLFIANYTGEVKPKFFYTSYLVESQPPFLTVANGAVQREGSEVYFQPFSFPREVRLWSRTLMYGDAHAPARGTESPPEMLPE